MKTIALSSIYLDDELQPRADIDRVLLDHYAQLLVDGVSFPPVVVFRDADRLLLADGFHRWHAHNALQMDSIKAEIIKGSREDALRYSLSANATHGAQRRPADFKRAYDAACRNGLIDPTDGDGVAAVLNCSRARGFELSETARTNAKAARAAEIIAKAQAGKSNRQITRETGVPRSTIIRVVNEGGPKIHPGLLDPEPRPASMVSAASEKLAGIFSPAADDWASALRALRLINEQSDVDDLFAHRFTELDHVFGPALKAAHEWINGLHTRFNHEHNQRRRA